ncbi:MAG: PqqD family protein [Chloroflexi bacterium]|nr:PqqD family protein [Chloroflexota bacterium]
MRSERAASSVPAARSGGLLIEHVEDETVVYDLKTKEAHCLKAIAAYVFRNADGHASIADIAARAENDLGASVSEHDVADAISQLEQIGLVVTPLIVRNGNDLAVEDDDGLSRRQMMRRIGIAGAVTVGASPLITSIVAPTAAMALSGLPTGCTGCGKNHDCLSGHCCQTVAGKSCNQSCCVGANNSCHITASNGCTVQIADTGCATCPCAACPTGSGPCCS